MCQKNDCGLCASCVYNSSSTTIHRHVCWQRMCLKIPDAEKAQPCGLANIDFNFFLTDGDKTPSTSRFGNFDDKALGLRLVVGRRIYACLHEALRACGVKNQQDVMEKMPEFVDKQLGIQMRHEVSHDLVGHSYVQKWITLKGRFRIACGKITKCYKSMIDDELSFQVEFDDGLRAAARATAECGLEIPACADVSEGMAWFGYASSCRRLLERNPYYVPELVMPFHEQIITPDARHCEATVASDVDGNKIPCLLIRIFDCELELDARKSTIPGAGMGLFVRCKTLHGLMLQAGELVDLGVYAPMRNEDLKSDCLSLTKNFINNWTPEGWAFEAKQKGKQYDITCDSNGDLHCLAKRNPLVYTNEVNGKREVATVHAIHDPERGLHYCLGHRFQDNGPLLLPYDEWIELKVQ